MLKLGGNNICTERDCAGEAAPGIGGEDPSAALPALGTWPVAESMMAQGG